MREKGGTGIVTQEERVGAFVAASCVVQKVVRGRKRTEEFLSFKPELLVTFFERFEMYSFV